MRINDLSTALVLVFLASSAPAFAQGNSVAPDAATPAAEDTDNTGEIVVTARFKRESDLAVPTSITAFSGADLAKSGAHDLPAIARMVPQLMIANAGNGQGGFVSFRGIASATEGNNLSDQSVSFNVDGIQISRATIARLGQFDVQQIEILKGPQSLFFGKNSPAGIVTLRSADPTPQFFASAEASYEFNASELRGEAVVSGPLTDTLGARFAVSGSGMRGWLKNVAQNPTFPTGTGWRPRNREIMGRGVLLFKPQDDFSMRLSVAYSKLDSIAAMMQPIYCPRGAVQTGDLTEDCILDRNVNFGALGPNLATAIDPRFGDGLPYMTVKQTVGSFQVNYSPSEKLALTSITGIYRIDNSFRDNFVPTAVATRTLANLGEFYSHEFSQEFRAQTNTGTFFDALLGVYYQQSNARNAALAILNVVTPSVSSNADYRIASKTYSAYGQIVLRPVEKVELSAGVRYTREEKDLHVFTYRISDGNREIVTARPNVVFEDASPEIAVTWRPTQRFTVYGNYKKGFLSGNFNGGAGNPLNLDRSYQPQFTEGFEAGFKASLMGGSLRVNGQAFSYQVTGLQVGSFTPNVVQIILNAGKVRSKGVEGDVRWTPVAGLSLHGAVAYTHARYTEFNAPCYTGQTIADGCNINLVAGQYRAQNLAGQQVLRSPDWTGNMGADYDFPLSGNLRLGIGGDLSFSSGFFGDLTNRAAARQKAYQFFNASIRLHDADDHWEFALIGRDLGDSRYFLRSTATAGSGIGSRTGTALTGGEADYGGEVNRGREIWVRAGYKF